MCKNWIDEATGRAAQVRAQGAAQAAIDRQAQAVEQSNAIAEAARKDANDRAAAAATLPADSETVRSSAEDRLRKLRQGSGFTGGVEKFGAGPVGFRFLTGQ